MTSPFRATLLSSLSSLGLLAIVSPALAQDPPPAQPALEGSEPAVTEPIDEETGPEQPEQPEPEDTPAPEVEPAPIAEPPALVDEPAEEPLPAAEPLVEEAPPAPSLTPLTVGTHTFSRFEYRENYDKLGVSRPRFTEGDTTVFRARLTFQTAELDLGGVKGSMYFAPQASGTWGTSGLGGTIGEANLGIYEGYFKFSGDYLTFKAGRFAMDYGDALVIGNLDWHQSGRAFDGAHLSAKAGKSTIDAFVTQTADGWPAQNEPFLAGDSYFWGVYGMFGPSIAEGLALDAYALARSWGASNTTDAAGAAVHQDAATFVTLGLRAKQKIGVFDYRAEADVQVGKQQGPAVAGSNDAVKKFAYQADVEFGLSPVPALRVALNGVIASGDDPSSAETNNAYDELFPTTHKWLGLMDVIGFRTNVASGNLKVDVNLPANFGLMAVGHLFWRPENGGLGRVDNEAKYAGFEGDFGLMKKIGGAGRVRGLYGIYLPNDDHFGTKSAAHYLEIEAGLKF